MVGTIDDILLVEDNPGDVRLVEEAFEAAGTDATLHVASSGDDALDFVYRRGEYEDAPAPDAVLLDWNLPRTGGEAVLESLKDDFPALPVVVVSGVDAEGTVASDATQPDAFMTKPSDPGAYVEAIRSVAPESEADGP
jgi:CheY-like chemotaxis protein